MGRLHDLHEQFDQSPWLDNLKRGWITSGELERWVARNPADEQKLLELARMLNENGRSADAGKRIRRPYRSVATTALAAPW